MSYEGYSQFLCKNGHQWTEDCMAAGDESKCPTCSEKSVWENMVDITNGSFEDGKRIDGYIELEIIEQKVCGECKRPTETRYMNPSQSKGE